MFKIFALVFTLVNGPVGPAGTQLAVMQFQGVQFQSEQQCVRALDAPVLTSSKESFNSYMQDQVKDEYKDHLQIQFVCSDKEIRDLIQTNV